ncbi:hypothetical protein BH20PSE1_BH20PSE1_00930 [soil metagenome]
MTVALVDIGLFLSGGAGNTDPNLSLGGVISTTRLLSQNATGVTIAGVTVNDASGNAVGTGTLAYAVSGQTLTWTPPGASAGVAVAVGTNGTYIIRGSEPTAGYLRVTVVAASLPAGNVSNSVTIANRDQNLFDDVTKAQAIAGDTNYRCYYLKNAHASDTATSVSVWIYLDSLGADTIAIGADPAGVGDGVSTGVAATIVNEATAPAGITFSQPLSEGAAINLGTFTFGTGAALWVKRTVPVSTLVTTADDTSRLRFNWLN